VLDTTLCGASRLIHLVNPVNIVITCSRLGVRLPRLKVHELLNIRWVLAVPSNFLLRFFRVVLEIDIQLLECVLNYCRHGQCTDTLQHIVEALSHVACHLTISPPILIISSFPLRVKYKVPLKKLKTTRAEVFVLEQAVV
jgi:hypothetical protein